MHPISAESMVAALFAAALGTGVYLVTLGYSIRWLVFSDSGRKVRRHINWIMLSASLAIFVFSTLHLSLAVRDTVIAVRINNTPHPANTKTDWSATVMCTVVNISILIVDAVLIYRCWLTCSKRKVVVIFPEIFWIGGLVCTILQVYWQVVLSADIVNAWQPVNMSIGPGTILTPFWGTTIVMNIYATLMIVYKIWQSGNAVKSLMASSDQLSFTVKVLLESGALYLIVAIPHFVVWFTPSSGAIVFFGWLNLPVAGTAFNLILIRISKSRAEGKKNVYSSSTGGFTGTSVHFTTPTLHHSEEEGEKSVKITTFGEESLSSSTSQV